MGVRVRGAGGGGGQLPSQIRAEQWGKQEECVKFRANQPLCPPLTKESPYAHVSSLRQYTV